MGSGSINFDQAVGYYDQTRMQTVEAEAEVLAMLSRELAGRGRCLEIGVGTGRIALPLWEVGIPMAGADISAGMLSLLVGKAGGHPPFPLVLADATALPFPGACVGAGLVSHVFHLIPPWREALAELVRVVRPGGVILVSLRCDCAAPFGEVRERFAEASGYFNETPGVQGAAELDAAFVEAGALVREIPPVIERREVRPADVIGRLERGEFSFTWPIPADVRARAGREVRAWARERFGSLEEPIPSERAIAWRAYDLPGVAPAPVREAGQ